MKNCNNCELKKFPVCDKGLPCCRCGAPDCNSRQPCPHTEENCQSDFDTIKVDIPLTMEEKLVLAEKPDTVSRASTASSAATRQPCPDTKNSWSFTRR